MTSENTEDYNEEHGSIIMSLISQLSYGMDLTKVTLPTFVLEPRSLLEKLSDFMSHSDLFTDIPLANDPTERFLRVLRWYLSGWHVRPRGVKKPYNPIIGETFRCTWEPTSGGSKTHYLAEQVSHHPPISAFAYCNRKSQLFVDGYVCPQSRFYGNSSGALMKGQANLRLLEKNEIYQFTFPDYYARGILMGKLLMETVGDVTISCIQTGLVAEISFVAKGMFTGTYNAVTGKVKDRDGRTIAAIEGQWDDVLYITKGSGAKEVFFDAGKTPRKPITTPPIAQQGDYESIKLWEKVTTGIKAKNLDMATEGKTFLEQRQRDEAKQRKERNVEWVTKHFDSDGGQGWVYKKVPTAPFSVAEIEKDDDLYIKKN